jgi:hypothetical protein
MMIFLGAISFFHGKDQLICCVHHLAGLVLHFCFVITFTTSLCFQS